MALIASTDSKDNKVISMDNPE